MTKLNLASGIYTMRGFQNLDPIHDGWTFQDGLPFYDDGSIEAVTVSCALGYLPLGDWPALFAEMARVLERGGVARIQDDWSDNPDSRWYPNGYHDVVTLTTPNLVIGAFLDAGFDSATQVTGETTLFKDRSLIQTHLHGGEPATFAVEGVR